MWVIEMQRDTGDNGQSDIQYMTALNSSDGNTKNTVHKLHPAPQAQINDTKD